MDYPPVVTVVEVAAQLRSFANNIDQLIDFYDLHDVAGAVLVGVAVEPLPDAAARARVHWNLTGDTGNILLDFHTDYTIVADDDGVLAIVAIEADSEVAAWKAAGWNAAA